MHCIKNITHDLIWVGANDRRLAMFEGVYSVPSGVSYNSYLLKDDKTVLFDTADKAVRQRFLENVAEALGGRSLDYLVVQHMEPDHSAAVCDIILRYPGIQVVCNAKTSAFIKQFHDFDIDSRIVTVKEGDTLETGRHTLHFVMAPMVHWPEVMVTYDSADKILFSADAFGCFGALNGAVFADEVNFSRDYMDEARRYYTNIVGKYGMQVASLLTKASALPIELICPLHGFIWRRNIQEILSPYALWSRYEPEEFGVMIIYASVYGNTENTAEILAFRLREKNIKTVMYDVSVTPASDIVAAAFKWSHWVIASTTYNAGIFITMEAVINDLIAHNIQKRTVAVIENGSWAAASGGLIRKKLSQCNEMIVLDNMISLKSSLKKEQLTEIDAMTEAIASTFPLRQIKTETSPAAPTGIDPKTLQKLSYGLYVLTAKDQKKDNGCIINTAVQITGTPQKISISVNKANFTCDMIIKTGEFTLSVINENASFTLFQRFGFEGGKDTDKFNGLPYDNRTANGIRYIPEYTNAVISGKVIDKLDYGSHMLFIADVTQAFILSNEPSCTYQYYFDHIKAKPPVGISAKEGFVCKICGFVYEGGNLPDDFICPLCKHGAEDFEKI
jgi:flavorubredoxin/flavin reductase (DIM6/NTAB) family NADH-FMN oxidoreductase RutF